MDGLRRKRGQVGERKGEQDGEQRAHGGGVVGR
jgi:hypothetical protein